MSTQPEKVVEMVNIEIDGQAMEVPKNSMIIEATDKAGISIPRFCYHSKLSIAANCRMCLVDVEKAPKPMPAWVNWRRAEFSRCTLMYCRGVIPVSFRNSLSSERSVMPTCSTRSALVIRSLRLSSM